MIASGFTYALKRSRNLGDVAQQATTISRMREALGRPEILAIANSLNDRSDMEDVAMSYHLVGYLTSPPRQSLLANLFPKKAVAAFRAGLFLWNARRVRHGRSTVLLNEIGTKALQELRDADGLLVSGAGAFNDRYGDNVAAVWAIVMRSVAILGKPVVVSGQQLGPFSRFLPRIIARWALNSAMMVGVRDPISIDVASDIGIPRELVVLTGDDAWGLKPAEKKDVLDVLERNGINRPFIAAQIRLDPATDLSNNDAPTLGRILDSLSYSMKMPVIFIRMYYAKKDDDATSAKLVCDYMKSHPTVIEEDLEPSLTKGILQQASVAIGISYHFCVFASSAGTPTIGLYRSAYMEQKVEGLTKMWPGHVAGFPIDLVLEEQVNERASEMTGKRQAIADAQGIYTPFDIKQDHALHVLARALQEVPAPA